MKIPAYINKTFLTLLVITGLTCSGQVSAQQEQLTHQALQSVAGHDFTLLRITLPPLTGNDDPTRGHSHPGDTIVYVESGTVTNQMNDEDPKEYGAGEFWVEGPGELHAQFRNNDPREPAIVVVFMIAGTGEPLVKRAQ